MYITKEMLTPLEKKVKFLNSKRPLSPVVVNKIREQFALEMTYNSNAIEGNTLTLKETFWVIQEGITIKGKSLKDHLEAKNHTEALEFLYDMVEHGKKRTISGKLIKELHSLVVRESQKDIAGQYRNGDIRISGSTHAPPASMDIPGLMENMVRWWSRQSKKMHPVELAALLHHKFVNIHPFWDGNGRTGRLLMNVVLLCAGYPLTIILKNDRKRYYRVLDLADKGDYQPLCMFVAQAASRSIELYLRAIMPVEKSQKLVELKVLSEYYPYSAAYLRKLATMGKLEALKKGRNWLSTRESVERYIEERQRKRKIK